MSIIAHDQPIKDEFGVINPDLKVPPMLKSLSLLVDEEPESEEVENNAMNTSSTTEEGALESARAEEQGGSVVKNSVETTPDENVSKPVDGDRPEVNLDKPAEVKTELPKVTESGPVTLKSVALKISNKVKVYYPAAWTPANKRANASLIYLYFRTVSWLILYFAAVCFVLTFSFVANGTFPST